MCLQYKPLFDAYCALTPCPMSAYHFSSIYAWSDHFHFGFDLIEDQLCVFAYQGKDSFLYLPPLGTCFKKSVIEECFRRMGKRSIARIENITENQLPALEATGYNAYHKSCEYVYSRKDLQALKGGAYKSKRHDVNAFKKRYAQAIFRTFRDGDAPGCAKLYGQWAKDRAQHDNDPVYQHMLEENALVHMKLIEQAGVLGLEGRVVENDGEIIGYSFGYILNPSTFCIALEIVDLTKTGVAAFIFNSFCSDPVVKRCDYINTMDDFGMPNIAKAKATYHPKFILNIYNIKDSA